MIKPISFRVKNATVAERERASKFRKPLFPESLYAVMEWYYCNGFHERVARLQLCKHGPTRNDRGNCVFQVRSDVTREWIEIT
jgi:hypothetical protein